MELYLLDEMARVEKRHWWFAARREVLAAVIAQLSLPVPAEARIVEIGCGTGGNLPMLKEFGRVRALESDAFARRQARDTGIEVLSGRLGEPLPFQDGSCDLVCLLDVLEHVEDDVGGLAAAGKLLRPTGRLLVTVPAYQWLFGPHDVSHHHYRRYTAGRLAAVAKAAGLRVERVGYFSAVLFPLAAASRVVDRLLGRHVGHATALPAPWLNSLLHRLFAFEAPVVARRFLPFGTSAIAVLSPEPQPGN